MSRTTIVVLNWNNWPDTLECLESLFRLDYPDFRVVICDNDSTDGSLACIRAWASGRLDVLPLNCELDISRSPISKPLSFLEYDRATGESGGEMHADSQLTIIRNNSNLGFAGGNNVGLRYVMSRNDSDYVWILNNDTVVEPGALKHLVARMEVQPKVGICGSTLMNYWKPRQVDALGGAFYSRWLGLAWHLGRGRQRPDRTNRKFVEKHMDYVVGASLFVSSRLLREVGLMEEDYFLYFEELDWATRARGRFMLAWSPASIVYHKVGGTIGTSSHPGRKSMVSDFYTVRNRIRFSRRYFPWALPTIYFGLFFALIYRLLFAQTSKAKMVLRLMLRPDSSFEDCCHD